MSDLATLSIAVKSDAKTAARDLDTLTQSGTLAEKAMKLLAGTMAVIGFAVIAHEAASLAKESAILAARFETMGVVMRTAGLNAGYSSGQMAELEKALRKTGISMIESRNALTSLSTANIDLSKAAGLARAAQDLAVVAGINSSEAFARMIHGIKSGEQEVLKTMGLNVQWEASYKKLAATLNKSSNDLTENEKLQARLGVVMKASAGYAGIYEASMSTAGKQMLSMTRYVEDLKVKFGTVFGPVLIAGVQAATEALKGMSIGMDRLASDGTLGKIGATLGGATAAGITAILTPIRFVIEHFQELKVVAMAVGVAMAFAFAPAGLAAVQNLVLPLISSMVGLSSAVTAYAASATAATVATGALNAMLGFLASPLTAVVLGVTLAVGAAMALDNAIRGDIDAVKAAGAAMDAHIAKNKQWLGLREEALSLEKRIAALQADGTKEGVATREVRIQETIKRAKDPNKVYTAEEEENLKRYATRLVDAQVKLKAVEKGQSDNETAERKAAEATKAAEKVIKQQTETLEHERIKLSQGEQAAYAYALAKDGVTGAAQRKLVADWAANAALKDENESRDRAIAALLKEADAHTSLMDTLNPAAKMAREYADAVMLINKYTDEGPEKAMALKAAYDTMTPSGKASAAALKEVADQAKRLDNEALRLNQKDDYETKLTHLNALNATGKLLPEAYAKEMHKLLLESNTVWGAMAWSIESFADSGASALANFFNGTKTGFREMIASLLIDMEKLILKEQVVAPFLKWGTSALASAFGGPSTADYTQLGVGLPELATGTNYVPQDMLALIHEGEAVVPKQYNTGAGGGSVTNHTMIQVTVQRDGTATTKTQGDDAQMAAYIGKAVDARVAEALVEHQRVGGLLAGGR